jgi:Fur family iron response transcriptional regulator
LVARERVEARLREHGVRPTPQRIEIALIFLDGPCHFSAEQVLSTLRAGGQRISKATVYNTLNLFSRHGILRAVAVDPARLIYDSTTRPHHHFYNADTGELIDIPSSEVRLPKLPGLPRATTAESIELIVRLRKKRPD